VNGAATVSDEVTSPRAALRALLRKRPDPYAGHDLARSKRLGGVLWLIGAFVIVTLVPFAPPDREPAALGWGIAAVIFGSSLVCAWLLLRRPDDVGTNVLLAMSYAAIGGVATLEWLAGGHDAPYHQLFFLSVVYTACVHPPRRVLPFLGAFVALSLASALYSDWSGSDVGAVGLQMLLTLGMAVLGIALMAGVRAQRTSLREEGDEARDLAATDPLTGLRNRRALVEALDEVHTRVSDGDGAATMLALFDLDGFKAYNDSYGHPAGDSLLARLAGKLGARFEGRGHCYRVGGDEFCLLMAVGDADLAPLLAAEAAAALSEEGEGFAVSCSYGHVLMPAETDDPSEALRTADNRMYAHKNIGRSSAGRQATDALLSVLAERSPDLGTHLHDVTLLARAVAEALGLGPEDVSAVAQAAALHDVGKAAIPDAILDKPAALDEQEWAYMRRHTLIGERILAAAPALARVAKLVRWSHERFEGGGYPDGIAGEEIPLGSRIIAVCDAYDAMVSDRPYRSAMSREVALDEIRRCAGTQFDPAVVDVFAGVLASAAVEVCR
jgi:diguanylate cyclase (GGDEF)-like protein